MSYILIIFVFYLIGSIPFGMIFSRLKGKDIRSLGSKNVGAANVYRNLGFLYGLTTFICDFLKAYIPLKLFTHYYSFDGFVYILSFSLIFGHCFSLFLRFKGGKGVSSTVGVLSFFSFYYFLIFIGVYIFIAITIRISSLSSMGALLLTSASILFAPIESYDRVSSIFLFFIIISIFVIFMHKDNIKRLINKNELQV